MSHSPLPSKVALFVDGTVGDRILRFLLEHNPEDIAWVVLNDTSRAVDERPLVDAVGHERIFHWSFAQTAAGLRALQCRRPEVVVLAWWPFLLAEPYLHIATGATLNLHPSLLPHCRGKDPNFWSIVEGRPFGVTIHHATAAMDAGPIAFQAEIPVSWTDTGGSLYALATETIFQLFIENYGLIRRGVWPEIPQDERQSSFHRRRELDDACRLDIDGHYKLRDILNLLRARTFPGMPACSFVDNGVAYEVRVELTKVG